jgi:outer membrane receptor protein involved in Fe transport
MLGCDRCAALVLLGWALVACAARARAQTRLGTIEVDADRPDEAASDEVGTGFVSTVDARNPTARAASVADLIEREAGIHVRSLGGLGAFTAVSIRGSDPSEVALFIDGVPLNRAGVSAVDLGHLSADGLERVEIYRGAVPIELGSQAVGGAINLVTRKGGKGGLRASVGGGSFGARSVTAGYSNSSKYFRVNASAAYRGATGDYLYYDYGGLQLRTDDDRAVRRVNNGFDQLTLDANVTGGDRTRFSLGSHGFLKVQGVPGAGFGDVTNRTASSTDGRLVVDGRVERTGWLAPALDARLDLYLLYERTLFKNTTGDHVGTYLRSFIDGESFGAGLSGRVQAAVGTHELWTLFASADADRYHPSDVLDPAAAPPPSLRVRAALAVSDDLRFARDRIGITPSLRLDGFNNSLSRGLGTPGRESQGSTVADAFVSPRLGARVAPSDWLTFKGNVGRYVRLPTTVELFGDGALIRPHPSLAPETAIAGDLGAVVSLAGKAGAVRLEATAFGREVTDFIALLRVGNTLSAFNIGTERFLGLEARAHGRLGRALEVAIDYTFIRTINGTSAFDGSTEKELPGVPAHRLGLRADAHAGPFSCYYELLYTGDTWRDVENIPGTQLPARTLHAVGVTTGPFDRLPVSLAIEVRNLSDLRVIDQPLGGSIHQGMTNPYPLVDVFDYPLPGRAIYATLTLHN